MGGINGSELLVLILVVLIVAGPEKLPEFAAQLGRLTREVKRVATGAKEKVRDEFGAEFDDVDFSMFDPRQYDPRRIVRDALLEDEPTPRSGQKKRPTTTQTLKSAFGPSSGAKKPATAAPAVPGEGNAPQSIATSAQVQGYVTPTGSMGPVVVPTGDQGNTGGHGDTGEASGVVELSGGNKPLSPREIVARTRGVRPAAESPVVLAALAPLGITPEDANMGKPAD